jgi:Tfp pilus assembly protein PilP
MIRSNHDGLPPVAGSALTRNVVSWLPALLAAVMLCLGGGGVGCGGSKKKVKKAAFGKKKAKKRRRRRRGPRKPKRVRKKFRAVELSEQDFAESPTNRDPFRSYMSEFRDQTAPQARLVSERNVLLKRYGLDEITLVAVVTGGVRARAMFRDPTGLGVTVVRGNYISKSEGRVKQILPGRVVVEIKESYEGGQKMADRVIQLHGKAKVR